MRGRDAEWGNLRKRTSGTERGYSVKSSQQSVTPGNKRTKWSNIVYIAVCMVYVLIYLFWYLNFVLVQVSVHTRIYIYTLYTQLVLYLFICMCVRIGVLNWFVT